MAIRAMESGLLAAGRRAGSRKATERSNPVVFGMQRSLEALLRTGCGCILLLLVASPWSRAEYALPDDRSIPWYPAGLDVPRGADAPSMQQALTGLGEAVAVRYDSVAEAITAARNQAMPDDRIVIFGSFYTVAEALRQAV